jgi:UDP-glucose 4-epimerase
MIMENRCLIIGGAGFLGLNLAKGLLSGGHKIVLFDRVEPRSAILDKVDFVKADLMDTSAIRKVMQKGDLIFYFACASLPGSPFEKIAANLHQDIEGFVEIIKLAIDKGAEKIVFPSSGGTVYGNPRQIPITEDHPTDPICYYGVTKLTSEKILYMFNRAYGLDYLILRIGNPFGPGQDPRRPQGLIPKVIKRMMEGENLEVYGDGKIVRDYIYIDDVVKAVSACLSKGLKNDIYNIGSGVGASINEVIKMASEMLKKEPRIKYLEKRPGDVSANVLSNRKLKSLIGWEPKIALAEGLQMTHDWLLEQGDKL